VGRLTHRPGALPVGVVDVINADNKSSYLVSHWEGLTYVISPSADVVER
jgi:hypothetical protein